MEMCLWQVLFDAAVHQVLHVMRLIVSPTLMGGATIHLMGCSGVGKKSCLRLAAFCAGTRVEEAKVPQVGDVLSRRDDVSASA